MTVDTKKGVNITVENLYVAFGKNEVLKNINFRANAGEIHCIIGPNGGGKTTFIRSLLGHTHHSGKITFEWLDKKGVIGYVPQIINIDKTLPINVLDFIALCIQKRPAFLGIDKKFKKQVDEILENLDMKSKAKYLFSELSGGERQRVLFAQALIPTPQLLILDEPMNSIDKSGAEAFSRIIGDLKNSGATIIWIHHDLSQVQKTADKVTCINRSVVFSGDPKSVMDEKNLLKIFSSRQGE
ncbi:MAG: metal ABC transporter ATP-binding protein [Chitinivibrionia bacterium]|jgi:zinc transport system ATP-binding protein|nr:metal ABC transporter ATP-binding protein [Chitinivibrionia bacterium]